jgi:hypothetical protein
MLHTYIHTGGEHGHCQVICIEYIGVVSVHMQYNCVYYCDTRLGENMDIVRYDVGVWCMLYVICYMLYVILKSIPIPIPIYKTQL